MSNLERKDLGVYIADQTAEGAVDANPVFTKIRDAKTIVKSSPTYTTSGELVTDGQPAQPIRQRKERSFSLETVVTEQTVTLLKEMLHGAETDIGSTAATDVATTATGFEMSSGAAAKIAAGDWFKATGFTDSDIDAQFFKCTAKPSATEITTATAPASVEAAGASVTITSLKTSSGTTKKLRTLQNRILDESKAGDIAYQTFFDTFIGSGGITVENSEAASATFELKVPDELDQTTIISGQTDTAEDETSPANNVNDIAGIYENGVSSNCSIKTMSIEFNKNYEDDGGSAGCQRLNYGAGTLELSGSITTRTISTNSMEWADKNKQGTTQALAIVFDWADSDSWAVIEITKAYITSHEFEGEGIVSNSMEWSGYKDDTGFAVQLFTNVA